MEKGLKVCCICKREKSYILEFVKYHLAFGFDQIIIGDNNDDDESYEEILSSYIKKNQVVIVNLRGQRGMVQRDFYNSIIDKRDYDWCAFIDADEFLTWGPMGKNKTLKEWLLSNPDVHAYKINWMCFGDNGHTKHTMGTLIKRFPTPLSYQFKKNYSFPENCHCKSLIDSTINEHFSDSPHSIKDGEFTYKSPSGLYCDHSPFNFIQDFQTLYIRHYCTKSLEEWIEQKLTRGDAWYNVDGVQELQRYPYTIDNYFRYNEMTETKRKFLKEKGFNVYF